MATATPAASMDASASGSPGGVVRQRNAVMDVLRVTFACLVLLSHSYINRDPAIESREFFVHTLRLPFTAGTAAVAGFFLLSGFLIVRSWIRQPVLLQFLQKRALRIVPGYAVAVALSMVYVGLLFPAGPGFFRGLNGHTALNIATLSAPLTPPVFPVLPYGGVNGSLWTITYEVRCYLLVTLLGALGFLRHRVVWLALTIAWLFAASDLPWQAAHRWTGHYLLTGDPGRIYTLAWPFLLGGCYALFRIPFRRGLAMAAAVGFLATAYLPVFRQPACYLAETGPIFFGGYLLFFLVNSNPRWLQWKRHMPDVSYGAYLYGWPLQCTLLSFITRQPWLVFALSVPLALVAGWLSWHFVERPAQAWKHS